MLNYDTFVHYESKDNQNFFHMISDNTNMIETTINQSFH